MAETEEFRLVSAGPEAVTGGSAIVGMPVPAMGMSGLASWRATGPDTDAGKGAALGKGGTEGPANRGPGSGSVASARNAGALVAIRGSGSGAMSPPREAGAFVRAKAGTATTCIGAFAGATARAFVVASAGAIAGASAGAINGAVVGAIVGASQGSKAACGPAEPSGCTGICPIWAGGDGSPFQPSGGDSSAASALESSRPASTMASGAGLASCWPGTGRRRNSAKIEPSSAWVPDSGSCLSGPERDDREERIGGII